MTDKDNSLNEIKQTLLESFGPQLDSLEYYDTDQLSEMSKKAAKSWTKGTKKFKDKVNKAKKAGMKNPEGFAAWIEKKATGHWPSED
jgi:hypothetical protein